MRMLIISGGIAYEAANAIIPIKRVIYCESFNLLVMPHEEKSKSCAMFELIAQRSESAVEVIAATIPHTASVSTNPLVSAPRTTIKGLTPIGIARFKSFALMPK